MGNSVDFDSDRSVGAKFGRGDSVRIYSYTDSKYGSGDDEGAVYQVAFILLG